MLKQKRLRRRGAEAVWFVTRHRRRAEVFDENEMMKLRPRRSGPMSLYELFCWHRANGTLALFFEAHPRRL